MSAIDSNNIWICDQCGAMVWWDRKKTHEDWHTANQEKQ